MWHHWLVYHRQQSNWRSLLSRRRYMNVKNELFEQAELNTNQPWCWVVCRRPDCRRLGPTRTRQTRQAVTAWSWSAAATCWCWSTCWVRPVGIRCRRWPLRCRWRCERWPLPDLRVACRYSTRIRREDSAAAVGSSSTTNRLPGTSTQHDTQRTTNTWLYAITYITRECLRVTVSFMSDKRPAARPSSCHK